MKKWLSITNMGVYTKVPIEQCWERTGKKPIGVRWVIVNKGDDESPNIRARLVGKEIKTDNRLDMFAATPPLEAKKFLFSLAATGGGTDAHLGEYKVLFIDIKRAYMYAPETREVYVALPEQDSTPGMCGLLNKSMYGTRGAAQSWGRHYESVFVDCLGFVQGKASICCLYHPGRDIRVVVHGDDFTCLAVKEQCDRLTAELKKHFELKVSGGLGSDAKDDKIVRILNRTVQWTDTGIIFESDPRHAEIVCKQLFSDEKGSYPDGSTKRSCSVKAVSTPGTKDKPEGPEVPLSGSQASQYRSLVMRINYLAQDRSDLQFAGKELARKMCEPTSHDWQRLKRLGRYLIGVPRLELFFRFQKFVGNLNCYVDSDYAGCLRTRKSTNGGSMMHGRHCSTSWSTNQSVLAISSGEAEFYALVKGSSELLGMLSIGVDLSRSLTGHLHSDSSAAIGMSHRRGLGKVKHLHTQFLWVQERVRSGDFVIHKERTDRNRADLMTKNLARPSMDKFVTMIGYRVPAQANALALRSA